MLVLFADLLRDLCYKRDQHLLLQDKVRKVLQVEFIHTKLQVIAVKIQMHINSNMRAQKRLRSVNKIIKELQKSNSIGNISVF